MGPEEGDRADRDWFAVDPKGRVQDPGAPTRRGPPLLGLIAGVLVIGVGGIAVANRMGVTHPRRPSPPVSVSAGPAVVSSPAPNPTAGPTVTLVGHALLGVTGSWNLFARGPGLSIRIDMARGRVEATPVPPLNTSGPVSFIVGPDQVLIRPLDGVLGYVVPDDGPATVATGALAQGGPVFPGPVPGQVWVQTGPDDKAVMSLVTFAGTSTGRAPIPVPPDISSQSAESDGTGSLIFQSGNGGFAPTTGGLRRITTGQVVAARADAWLVSDCDDRHQCSTALVDRRTGTRRTLDRGLGGGWAWGSFSPDGRYVAIRVGTSGGASLLVIDLTNGTRRQVPVALAPSYDTGPLTWSPDSRWLFTVTADQAIGVIDTTAWHARPLGVNLPPVSQLAVRP